MRKFKNPREVIVRPVLTEKTDKLMRYSNCYVFQIHEDANKIDVRNAIEKIWDVRVVDVNTMTVKGKKKRVRYKVGKTAHWKKAIVKLAEGNTIDIY